ncbi:type II secretion system protein J [Planobispora siamensis]|uniref:Prepilin-type N-terminal cleavage/methylation domain-containing protein n=1 Tax=Planobispora siamensis TaxID=936338 RepID=A0A8J3SCC5_9ACTN|nr:prepilin-type N-terminal cleavage/methylation domain-containing protein [Planobispora siamensis]GIH89965.1 hypothetical protein Psi01_05950 [Planobispora siamensis]
MRGQRFSSRLAARLRGVRSSGDAGISLVEVMVTVGIMGILMAIFTTGILQVYRSVNVTESVATAQSQLNIMFQRLDKEIRYASWVAEPGLVRNRWYVEFAGTSAENDATECGQLRLDLGTGVMQLIRWTPGSPPAEGRPGQTLASQIVTTGLGTGTPTPPFELQEAGSFPYGGTGSSAVGADFAPDYQRLRLHLTTRVSTSSDAAPVETDITFTALNTSRETKSDNVCDEGRPQ